MSFLANFGCMSAFSSNIWLLVNCFKKMFYVTSSVPINRFFNGINFTSFNQLILEQFKFQSTIFSFKWITKKTTKQPQNEKTGKVLMLQHDLNFIFSYSSLFVSSGFQSITHIELSENVYFWELEKAVKKNLMQTRKYLTFGTTIKEKTYFRIFVI